MNRLSRQPRVPQQLSQLLNTEGDMEIQDTQAVSAVLAQDPLVSAFQVCLREDHTRVSSHIQSPHCTPLPSPIGFDNAAVRQTANEDTRLRLCEELC